MPQQASAAEVVRKLFIDQGLAVSQASPSVGSWPVVAGPLPATGSDNYLSVQDTGGDGRYRIYRTGEREFHPTVSVTIRSIDYHTGVVKGKAIEALFDAVGVGSLTTVTLGSERYTIWAAHVYLALTKIGQEEQNRRQLFTVNVRLTMTVVQLPTTTTTTTTTAP